MERVDSPDDPRIADFVNIREAELVRARGIFIAEGITVVRTMVLRSRFPVRAILLAERHVERMQDVIDGGAPVFVASQEVLNAIAGFDLHRGCLASGERSAIPNARAVLDGLPERATVLYLEALADHDNVGAIFRSAAAFGADAVFLDPSCADPLYRKAIRVSMGAALTVPFARLDDPRLLEKEGFELWALTPATSADDLASTPRTAGRVALMLGAEGPGLTGAALKIAKKRVRIAIDPSVDSLNVATAGAIALFVIQGPKK